ncbi:MAG TPA: hypothetical protein VNJ02_05010 [Vicinamibacterales bacterium]|nr:hypothetical protein [Vicinamibacterales bacterium]
MKVLFLARHFGYLRNYEATLRGLLQHGHQVHVAADREEALGARQMVERWSREWPGLTMGWTPDRESDDWFWLASRLRLAQDFLRYQHPRYDSAPQLRQRAQERIPTIVLGALKVMGFKWAPIRAVMQGSLNALERSIPPGDAIDGFFTEQAADLVLITPLVELGSPQTDLLRGARRAGTRTALCVGSWDHLSSKSVVRDAPDRVFVWNEIQKREAIDLHRLDADRIVVTGAQCYDEWFERQPSTTRDEFCRAHGFAADRPVLLWTCSSLFRGGRPESELVEEWVKALRTSENLRLREAGILIRPHPQRIDEWRRADLSAFGHVAIKGGYPVDAASKASYFDALYHSAVVVGLNTSSLIEAGIIGRPVLSIVDQRYSRNQEGTLHWRYLSTVGGGLLQIAHGLGPHIDQLAAILDAEAPPDTRPFVAEFVRPHGLSVPATPALVAGIEAMAGGPAPARAGASATTALRPLLYPIILLRHGRGAWLRKRKVWKRDFKRWWQGSRRSLKQAVKSIVLKRLREDAPSVVLAKPERQRARAQNMFAHVEEVEETKEALTALSRSGKPILVGPWLSETGFELLYWIPFLNWAKAYANLRDDRLVVISRGGCQSWYRHLTSGYQDVFDFYSPDEFRSRNDQRILQQGGALKHNEVADFDHEILDRAAHAAGLTNPSVLHPSLMYKLFRIFWRLEASIGLVQGFTHHRRIEAPELGELARHLPERFLAVKFYASNSMPDTAPTRQFIARYLAQLTARHHVVLLNTGVRFDDHDDFRPEHAARVHTLDHLMTPRNNLDVQTRVIGASEAFVGTYGGFSYLAPLCGIDTVAFYNDPTSFRMDHLELSKRVFNELNAGAFVPLALRDLDVVRLGLGGAVEPAELTTGTPS